MKPRLLLTLYIVIPRRKILRGGILFWRCPSVRSLSVRRSRFSVQTHILVMVFQISLPFNRNMYLHMGTAHTRFACTTGNRVIALCYFQLYIVDSKTFCPDTYLGNGFSDFIIPCRRFWGGYSFGVVCPSCLFLSVQLAMDYRKLTCYWPRRGKAVSCLQRSEQSTGYGTQVDS